MRSWRYFPAVAALLALALPAFAQQRPNILWIIAEDQSDHYGPYGEKLAKTPNVDRLAEQGALFTQAFVTAPVCSPSRSALITGMYQTSIGAHNHRSGRGAMKIHLPRHVRLIPEMLKEAGYYVTNGGFETPVSDKLVKGKTDYNFEYPDDLYHGADWAGRKAGQPFFAQVQLRGGKHRNQQTLEPRDNVKAHPIDVNLIKLPPYYPRHPDLLTDWAQYLQSNEHVDWDVGRLMKRLEKEGVTENTIVFFLSDHGVSHARGKQFLYEEGIKIPLIAKGPGIPAGKVRDDLVAHIDIAATALYFAGVEIPDYLEARPLFGPDAEPRDYVVSARDRCDETVDRIRSVRTARYKYIRNFYPHRPHLQPNRYKDNKQVYKTLRKLHKEGKLNVVQGRVLFSLHRAEEELYDLEADPFELNNLAGDPTHEKQLVKLRGILKRWIEKTGDKGEIPESVAAYDAEMTKYFENSANPDVLYRNIRTMQKWDAEGK